jgi:hypothetical protein
VLGFSAPLRPLDVRNHDLLYNNRPVHSLKKHCENVSEKEPIFADEGATVRALLKNKNAEK